MRIFLLYSFLLSFVVSSHAQNVVATFPELLGTIDHFVFKEGSFKTTKQFQDKHNLVSHSYGYQTFNGVEIEGAYYNAHAQNGKIVAFHNSFIAKEILVCKLNHSLSKEMVLANFLESNKEQFSNTISLENIDWKEINENQFEISNKQLSPEVIRFKKTYINTENGLVPSWSFSFLLPQENHWYYSIVNAATGEIIKQFDWIISCDIDHDHAAYAFADADKKGRTQVAAKKGDGAQYNSFPIGVESPIHGSRSILVDPSNSIASPYGWHDTDAVSGAEFTITRGNNVWAREDRDANNTDGYSPDGGTALEFDFPFATSAGADDNLDAAITNLFVWNNFMHDVWYQYGFDEESGNFQANNYGKAEFGAGDFVFADAQDGSGTNNANFATPEDGYTPRMQMFLWGAANGTLGLDVYSPANIEGSYSASGAAFGPSLTKEPIIAELVLVNDGTSTPTLGCAALSNSADINGKIALIERGTCTFVEKVRNAQNAGAIAVIIYTDNRGVIEMGGDGTESDIIIPAIMIQRSLGLSLKNESVAKTFEVAIYDSSNAGGFDSDFDNGVIAHEYTHGISTRLTGGALNSNCLRNQEQMGEGWSDFFALVMTHKEGDKGSDLRGIGTYLVNQPITGGGIRPYPYTTDADKSPYAYENIAQLSIPHGVGAVWCAMLWEMYWAFIDEYGYDPDIYEGTGGNNICVQLVVDGMKLQPCNPGFTDGRDAILLADKLNNGGKNEKLIWTAFTKRGLGWDADGGDPNNVTDGKNGFELPPKFRGFVGITKTAVEEVNEDQIISYKIVIENQSDKPYTNVVITDTIPSLLVFDANSTDCDWVVNDNILTLTIAEMPVGSTIECNYNCSPKPGGYTEIFLADGAEETGGKWSTVSDVGTNEWNLQSDVVAEGNSCWFVANSFGSTDQSLMFNIGLIEKGQILSFQHYYNTDGGRDGGVIEFTEDGTNWFDAETYFTANGYNAVITNNPNTPLNGRGLFSGNSNGFITSQIDLSAFVGKDILVRFRFASDRFFSGVGWYVDDLKIQYFVDVTNKVWGNNDGNIMGASATTVIYDVDKSNSIENPNEVAQNSSVYPNPADNFTHIILNENIAKAQLIITDLAGKEIYRNTVKAGSNTINTENFAKGSYLITIEYNGTSEKHQLVKL